MSWNRWIFFPVLAKDHSQDPSAESSPLERYFRTIKTSWPPMRFPQQGLDQHFLLIVDHFMGLNLVPIPSPGSVSGSPWIITSPTGCTATPHAHFTFCTKELWMSRARSKAVFSKWKSVDCSPRMSSASTSVPSDKGIARVSTTYRPCRAEEPLNR